ncbi:hypothetical protein ACJMK2_034714 [Sinanodonta woodiana]|uniref:Uncharacterized protein n=1 Tax=Sinanodonta woodiana TaxID=1069815 RepID=A0ABD3WSJ5_SINWO
MSKIYEECIPILGAISYEMFSTNIMLPRKFSEFWGKYHMRAADVLWFNAHIGIGLYLYQRPHLQRAPVKWRVVYSLFGTAIFNFGSVLFWGVCKTLMPESPILRFLFGLSSGVLLLFVGKRYLDYIDFV